MQRRLAVARLLLLIPNPGTKMSWEEYLKSRAKRFTFVDFGCPDFWVELRLLASFPYGEAKRLMALATEETEATVEMAEDLLVRCILDWNLTHPQTGKPLELPSVDKSVLEVLPSEFVLQMQRWLIEEAGLEVPLETGT